MDIVDTHQHLWDQSLHTYSWCGGIPALNRSFVMRDYIEFATQMPAGARVTKAIHMEADVDEQYMEAETAWVLGLAASPDNPTAGVVACCRPERADFRAFIDKFVDNKYLKGVRRVLHTQPDDLSRSSLFAENLKQLPNMGLTFDLCVLAKQLPVGIELAKRCPEVTFILDHCGVPDVKNQALDPWREHLRELSKLPNVNCKISGLVAYADATNWKPNDLKPFVDHAIECFGWDRVVFGSDWPVCTLTTSFGTWVTTLLELLKGATDEQKQKLFNRNATRIYRLTD